jgi:hypothetical protein
MADPAPWASDPTANAPQAAPQPATAPSDAPWEQDNPVTPQSAPAASTGSSDLPGFTDEQKQQILAYIPKATDAADLERFSSDLTGGRSHLGNAEDVLKAYQQGHRTFAWQAPTAGKALPTEDQSGTVKDAIGEGLLNGIDAVIPGLGTYLRQNTDAGKAFTEHFANSIVADYGPEVGGVIDSILKGGPISNNIAHERATLEGESDTHPVASIAGELGGAATTGALGNEAGLANLPKLGRAAVAVGEGAAYGSGAAGPDNRAIGAATGAALGGATEAAIPLIAKIGASRAAAKTVNQEFADAANRQGVSYMAADLPNALKSKFATALSSLTLGGIPLAEQGAKNVASGAAAVGRVAGDIGTVGDSTAAGQAAQRGAQSFLGSTEAKMGDLYDAIPIAPNAPAAVSNTRSMLGNLMQSFQSNPKLAAVFKNPQIAAYMDALTPQTNKVATGILDEAGNPIMRDEVHGGGLSWEDLKDFRTRVGKIIGQPSLASDGQQIGELRALYSALSDDMQATAKEAGPQAANAFNRANAYARARANRIENVVSLILGNDQNKAPQTAFEALQRLGNEKGGDAIKLGQALRSMPEDEANTVRATMLDNLGDANPGAQSDKGDVFSPSTFVTNWNKISERAKNVLFTGQHRQDLNDLAMLFSGMKSSTKFANNSKTGLYVAGAHTLAVSLANPVLGALDAGLQYGGGRLLASHAFARRIASTPKSLSGARAFWSRPWVGKLAAENPAIAGEIRAFQAAFLNHANDNAAGISAASAQPDGEDQQQ